jgi:hypothetical protein
MIQSARGGGEPRLLLELALFKAARPEDDSDPDALLARVEALESRPAGAASPAPAAAPAPTAEVPEPAAPPEPPAAPEPVPDPEPVPEPLPDPVPEPVPEPAPEPEPDPGPEHPPEPEPISVVAAVTEAPALEVVEASWDKAVGLLLDESPKLGAVLENSKPLRVDGRALVLGFPQSASFYRKSAEQTAGREMIVRHLEGVTGFAFALQTETIPDDEFNPALAAREGTGIDHDELVATLKQEFDATEVARSSE